MACNTQQTYPTALLQQMARSLCSIVNEGLPDYSIWAANVKRFGAVGNAVTDDRVAIVAAIDSVAATGGVVYFPPGRYYTSSSIPVPYSTGITLQGTGVGSEVLSLSAAEGNKFAITGSNVTVDRLFINGAYVSGPWVGGMGLIEITNAENITVSNCAVKNSRDAAIRVYGNSKDILIQDNDFTNNWVSIFSSSTGAGLTPQRIRIITNDFGPCWGTADQSGGIKLQATHDAPTSSGHVIEGNTIDGQGQMGIEIRGHGMADCVVDGNFISKTNWGISLDSVKKCSITGNVITLFEFNGIEVASLSVDVTVTGNVIEGNDESGNRNGGYGIITSNVSRPRDITITGNSVRGTLFAAIHIQHTDGAIVSGNTMIDCGLMMVVKGSNNVSMLQNRIVGITEYHFFIEAFGQNTEGITIDGNILEGRANSDNLMIYDNDGIYTMTRLVVRNNNISDATYGNLSINYNIPIERLPELWISNNYAVEGVGRALWPNAGGEGVEYEPFDPEIQGGGVPVAKRYTFNLPASAGDQWVKIFSMGLGRPIVLPFVLQSDALGTANNTYSTITSIVTASPYGQESTIMKYPDGRYNVPIVSEIIYNNPGSLDVHEIWIKFSPCDGSIVTILGSDFPTFWIESPTPVSVEPIYAANHYIMDCLADNARLKAQYITADQLIISDIPTSSAGLPSGTVWSDSGTLKIV